MISQVYGGGGNTGAPFTNDFVELFNRGGSEVSLDGWSLQYASATGTGTFATNKVNLSGALAPGGYHLVRRPTALQDDPLKRATGSVPAMAIAGHFVNVADGRFEQAPGCVNVIDVGGSNDLATWVVRAVNVAPSDPAHRRTIVEHHGARGVDRGLRRVRRLGRRAGGFRGSRREIIRGLGPLSPEHVLFDRAQATHLLPHLDLGMAVGLQHRLGQVAEEVVVTVAVRHVGEFRRDGRDERVLLVRHPEPHRRGQGFGPLLRLLNQASDLVRGGREQRLGEPDALPGQLPHDIKGLVSLLGLEAVDAEDDLRHGFVVSAE